MKRHVEIPPGTVSKIIWHFTQGPEWDENNKKYDNKPKDAIVAYKNLCNIIASNEIKLGRNPENIKGDVQIEFIKDKTVIISPAPEFYLNTAKVVCFAEIPIQHLNYHSKRYGKFSIGFLRHKLIELEVNPVHYQIRDSLVIGEYRGAFESIHGLWRLLNHLEGRYWDLISRIEKKDFEELVKDKNFNKPLKDVKQKMEKIERHILNLGKFIKTIRKNELNSIYCEREWRCTQSISFTYDEIAMIILPKKFHVDFIEKKVEELDLPRTIPIIPWEDLLEH